MRERSRLSFYATLRYHSCYFLAEEGVTVYCHLEPDEDIKAVILCLREILRLKSYALRRYQGCHGRYLMYEGDIMVTLVKPCHGCHLVSDKDITVYASYA